MRHLVSAVLLAVGVIHLLPLSGALGNARLGMLYGISVEGADLEILLRHRAVLFGILGLFLVAAAFRPALQPIALAAGIVSVASFLWLAWAVGGYHAKLARVVTVDIIALAGLLVGVVASWRDRHAP